MCRVLNISRSTYYSLLKNSTRSKPSSTDELAVIEAFKDSRQIYGARKIKQKLLQNNIIMSRRKIRRIMVKHNLVSVYTKKHYSVQNTKTNTQPIDNIINRNFNNRASLEVVVSDLTYVNIAGKWHYICILIDLFNREIIGHSIGCQKNAELVKRAFHSIPYPIDKIMYFHTDRGSEFDNRLIEQVLEAFDIKRSLSHPGSPYDNAVAESTFKSIKIEFIYQYLFKDMRQLEIFWSDYVNWWNKHRLHGGICYKTPHSLRLTS